MKKIRNRVKSQILNTVRVSALAGAFTMYSAVAWAAVANDALPTGGKFMGGTGGTITSANGVMNVNQVTSAAAIKWETFNVGANATINFNMNGKQDGHYNILNYSENAGVASEIYGRMKAGADAHVWLVNPNGVLIGKGAQIDVGHMHMATHKLTDADLNAAAGSTCQEIDTNILRAENHTAGELMSMGNVYVNSISFDGNRVVLDADKLYTYAGDKVELGEKGKLDTDDMVHKVDAGGNITSELVERVYMGQNGALKDISGNDVNNNTGDYAQAAAAKGGNTWTGDALNGNSYLTIGKHAKEVVVGYTAYDEKATAAGGGTGSYENSANWRALYTTLADFMSGDPKAQSERVGFAWVEDSKQLERIGEGTKTLGRDFALKDGIAAIGTQEYNGGLGFKPIGNETTPFTGKFDGLTYDIYGLTINRPNSDDVGLFGQVGDGAVIRNVDLVSGSIVGNENVGGVVGHAVGNVTLKNVVNSSLVLGVNNVGGIIGKAEGTSVSAAVNIINAENVALIRGNTNVGGIAGNINNTTITGESYNSGAVRGIVNYKVADSAYASKKAFELTSAKYDVDGGYSVGSQVVYKVGDVEKVAFVKTLDSSGNPASYVDEDGNDVTTEALDATRLLVRIEAGADKGTSNMNNAEKKTEKHVFEARGSHDVGGLVGTGKNVAIGNDSEAENLFEIYNGVEILGGYNVGGIAGSIAKSDAGSNIANVIQNVANKGNVVAKGFDSDSYYYQSRFYANGTNVSAYVNASDTNMDTKNNTYYGEETLKDSDWVKGNYMKQTVAVANVGGIVGLAEGSAAAVTNIKNVSNYADVKSDTKTESMTIVKYDTVLGRQVATDYDTTYSLAGNVGGIVGKATSGTISGVNTSSNRNGVSTSSGGGTGVIVDYATNKENFVLGAHNVGGIVGYGFNTTVKNSVNDGGDISMTGARNQDQFTSVIGRYANGLNMWDYGFSHEISRGTVVQQTMYADYVTGNVGGIMGYMLGDDSYVENSRNRGYIHTQDLEEDGVRRITNEAANVGGIVGKVGRSSTLNWDNTTLKEFNDTTKVAIKSSSNEGKVSGYSGIGGIVGQMYNGEIMTSKNLGNIVSSFAQNSFNEQANMGGILGDTPAGAGARDSASVKIYDSFNEGVIGDTTFETYGRHVGGVAGRLLGEISKAYNAGDMYTGSDNIGGIVGYVQSGGVYNVYNKGNITNYVQTSNGVKIGGIVGRFENSGNVNDAYNLGIIRSFIDNKADTDVKHVVGGIIGENGSANNVYSTGEIYAAHTNALNEWVKSSNQVGGIKPGGAGISNYRVVLAEDPSLWSLTDSAGAYYTIEYKDRYNINAWTTGSQALQGVVKEDTTDKVINRTDSKFRMYLYDQADGVSVTYGATTDTVIKDGVTYTKVANNQYSDGINTITVVGTMPILNKYVPYVYGGYDRNTPGYLGNKIGTDIKYIQVGTEYNPLQLNIFMNTPDLNIDYATAEMSRSAHINVQNGNLNLSNINNADFFLAGNFVALNGDVTIAGSAERLNISSNTNIVGQNVRIENLNGSIENNATVTSTAGDITIQGKGVTNFGSLTALGQDDSSLIVKGVSAAGADVYGTEGKTSTEIDALKARIYNPKVQLNNKGVDVYSNSVAAPSSNGNITITTDTGAGVTGDVNLYLGNNKLGKISTEGNMTIVGDNVYSDSDYKLGYGTHASTKWTVNGNDIVLDFSNMAATVERKDIPDSVLTSIFTPAEIAAMANREFNAEEKSKIGKYMLHQMLSDFSKTNTKGNEILLAGADGSSATKAMLTLDYFDDNNILDLAKYDVGGQVLHTNLANLKVSNGGTAVADANTLNYAWIENAEQLLGIQKAFEGNATEYARINELKVKKQTGSITPAEDTELTGLLSSHSYNTNVMAMNYALKNDIDASDLAHFISIGLKADGTDTKFTGTFDGRDHDLNSLSPSSVIDGVKVENSTGLFSTIGTAGTVKDLFINSSQLVANSTRVGLVAGTNEGTINNVRTYGNTVKDANTVTNNPVFIGGLVGFNAETGKIINSVSEDIVYAENEKGQADVGGIVGLNAGIVYESTGKSDVSVADGGATSLGGVAGVNAGLLKDVIALGVTAGLYEHGDGTYTGALNVGGIAGENRTVYDTKAGVVHTDGSRVVTYTVTDENGNVLYSHAGGGVIADAYNDSKVKGWSNTGGIVGKNFGTGDSLAIKTQTGVTISTDAAGNMFYVANAADVIAGQNAGGLAGVNNGSIKGTAAEIVVTDIDGNKFTYNAATNALTSAVDKNGVAISETTEAKEFYNKYIVGSEEEVSQVIYGRNAGKITAKSGLVDNDDHSNITDGTNVGGLIGISGPKADVDHLLNGKAASVYGKVNVGGLIGLNQGVLQNSVNLMQNNDIAGALNVGGIVGENSGIIAKIENTNKFNITVNEDYVNLDDGSLKETIYYDGVSYVPGTANGYASFFGGILGHNAATGTAQGSSAGLGGIVADVVNTANVTIEHPANYVGGIMGKNDGTIGYAGMTYNDATGTSHEVTGYLRNDGAVGVINGENKGEYIGGVIGQNNKDIYMVDITNSIKGTVYGYDYVGGIVGQNTAVISGGRDGQNYANRALTAEDGNYYKYDVYNNGMVTGTTNVGGLIGDNFNNGTIKLAYNTGVVRGLDVTRGGSTVTNQNIGGIVGSNEGVVDQVFNSTAIYNVDGKKYADLVPPVVVGVSGNTNVGGLVGNNASVGTISNAYNTGDVVGTTNVGSVIGNNIGELNTSYSTDTTKRLVGTNTGTLDKNYSLYASDSGTGITVLSAADSLKTSSYRDFSDTKWTFYNNASTPLLKNFLTKAYFVPAAGYDDAFTYNAQQQGGVVKVESGHIYVYKVVNGAATTEKLGEIFAADVNGDHSLKDYLMTRDANGNGVLGEELDGQQLIIGKSDGVNANSYSLLYSNQINTYYNKKVVNNEGIVETVVNPNMLGYEFFEAKLTDAAKLKYDPEKPIYDPSRPDIIPNPSYDPSDPESEQTIPNPDKNPTDAVKPEDTDPKIPTGDDFVVTPDPENPSKPKSPEYVINRVVLNFTASDVERIYGQLPLSNGTAYTTNIDGKGGLDTIVEAEKADLLAALGTPSTPDLSSAATGSLTDSSLVDITGKTTKDVGDYTWTSTTIATADNDTIKNLLANYTFDEAKKNDFNEGLTWQQKLGVTGTGDTGTISTLGKATVTQAELVITATGPASKVYGDAYNAAEYGSNFVLNGGAAEIVDPGKTNAVTNGDKLIDIINNYGIATGAYSLGNTNDVGDYTVSVDDKTVKNGVGEAGANYKVTFVDADTKITPKELTVNINDIVRYYGNADAYKADSSGDETGTVLGADNGTTLDGWVYGEDATLASKVYYFVNSDGGTDISSFSTNLSERVTNHVNTKSDSITDYTWTISAALNDPALKNYTFKDAGGNNVTSTTATANSFVKPVTLNVKLNDFNIVYGAILEDTTAKDIANGINTGSINGIADLNSLYLESGSNVYTDNVGTLYKVATTGSSFVNGDTAEDVIQSITGYNKAGFTSSSHTYGTGENAVTHLKTEDVSSSPYTYTVAKTDIALEASSTNDYNIGTITGGNVYVKHAILTADGGGDIYRYYGEEQKYKLNAAGTGLEKITDNTYPVLHDSVAGYMYGENYGSGVSITHDSAPHDGGLALGGTSDVGAYTWGGGELSMSGAVTTNYRFWDPTAHNVAITLDKDHSAIGGASYVIPQTITVSVKNQEFEYGTTKADAAAAYIGGGSIVTGITGNLHDAGATSFVSYSGGVYTLNANSDGTDASATLNSLIAANVSYNNGSDKAFVSDLKTNNASDTYYQDSISINADGTVLQQQNMAFIPSSLGTSYMSLGTNANYRVVVEDADAKVTKRMLTVSDISGTVVYGKQDGNDEKLTGGVLDTSRVVYGDDVKLNPSDITILDTGSYKTAIGSGQVTPGVNGGTPYANSIEKQLIINNSNYEIVDNMTDKNPITSIKGGITVTPANLTITLNDFNVLYGDTKSKYTINDDYSRNTGDANIISNAEKDFSNHTALANGDSDINAIFGLAVGKDVTNGAFVSDTQTNNAGGYTLTLADDATNLTGAARGTGVDANKLFGTSANTNYNVTVIDGHVDVLAKKVIVIDPKDPNPPVPSENPDYVYMQANNVERTYGDSTHMYVTNDDGTTTPVTNQVKVDGLASWDGGSITVNPIDVSDGGYVSLGATSKAGDYQWTGSVDNTVLSGFGSNYVLANNPSAPSATVTGDSKVHRAQLTIKLSDKMGVNRIEYGTNVGSISYDPATVVNSETIGSTTYTTTYSSNPLGLAAQDSSLTNYLSLFTFDDENTGYVNGIGQNVTSDGTTPITYHHNAKNATSDKGAFTVVARDGSTSFNNPVDNKGVIASGISTDGNYEVHIINGDVQFTKKALTVGQEGSGANVEVNNVTRVYGDTALKPGSAYDANILRGLADWDGSKNPDLIVKPTHDGGLTGTGDNLTSTSTSDVGVYTWQGVLDPNTLPDWVKNNYDIGTLEGKSTVERAELVIQLDNFHSNPSNSGTTHNPIIYGTQQGLLNDKYPYSFSEEAGKGLAQQDVDAGITINAGGTKSLFDFNYVNTGYTSTAATANTKDIGAGYNLQATDVAKGNITGESWTLTSATANEIKGTTKNYNVTIKAGDVEVIKREVSTYDPNNPGPDWPTKPGDPSTPWDPTKPADNPNDPSSPFNPKNDPTYDPTDPTDPRNQMLVTTNIVERTYGDTTITGTSDSKPSYGFDIIYGAPGVDPSKITLGTVSDTGITSPTTTNNAGNSYVWDAGLTSTDTVFNTNFDFTEHIVGGSIVNRANLVVNLSDHLGIVYGVGEDQISYKYTETSITGLAPQDGALSNVLTYEHKNTGYIDGVGQPAKDSSDVTIDYVHTVNDVNLQDGYAYTGSEHTRGATTGISLDGNYNVTINDGDVNFQKRPVNVLDPNNPTPPYDPSKPERPSTNPSDPNYDPTYNPTDPTDPRNQLHVSGNTVERYEGNVAIIGSKDSNGNPDGHKGYAIDKIYGLPTWIDPSGLGVTVDPVPDDGGVIGPMSTNKVGTYGWTGTLQGLDLANFEVPPAVPGISIVKPNPVMEGEVEDRYPWLHRTNNDHGWGHQEHWRERKAEVNFVEGGADFFNDKDGAHIVDGADFFTDEDEKKKDEKAEPKVSSSTEDKEGKK